jgi:DNA polymerase III alpha subunit
MTAYSEFAVASNFSFLRGASHPEELMLQAAQIGLAGLGLCDRNSVAGVVRAHLVKREQNLSLRYHPGARLVFADGTPDILAYPRDRPAWGRLCRLLTRGNLRAEKGDCLLELADLLDHSDGLELVLMPACTRDSEAPRVTLPPTGSRVFPTSGDPMNSASRKHPTCGGGEGRLTERSEGGGVGGLHLRRAC